MGRKMSSTIRGTTLARHARAVTISWQDFEGRHGLVSSPPRSSPSPASAIRLDRLRVSGTSARARRSPRTTAADVIGRRVVVNFRRAVGPSYRGPGASATTRPGSHLAQRSARRARLEDRLAPALAMVGIVDEQSCGELDPREGAALDDEARGALSPVSTRCSSAITATLRPTIRTSILGRLLAEWACSGGPCPSAARIRCSWPSRSELAAIARGRFIVQCGLGYDEVQFAAMGTTSSIVPRPSRNRSRSSAPAPGDVSSSRRFTFQDARLALRPPENVEYWIGASARPAIDRAARLADGFLASPSLTLDEARDQAAFYLERCKVHGRTPKAVAIRRDIYVGDSAARGTSQGRDPGDGISWDPGPGARRRLGRECRQAIRRARFARLHRRHRPPPDQRAAESPRFPRAAPQSQGSARQHVAGCSTARHVH